MLITTQRIGILATRVAVVVVLCYLYLFNSSFASVARVENAFSTQKIPLTHPMKQGIQYTRTSANNSVLQDIKIHHEETTSFDGVLQYTRTQDSAKPDLLWLTLTYDSSSWGQERGSEPRTITDFLQVVILQYDVNRTSIGILTSSLDEYIHYKSVLQLYDFPHMTILMQPGISDGQVIDRAHRHDEDVQAVRRAELAKLRNYLMLKALKEEEHVLWLDADVFQLDHGIVKKMLSHVQAREDVGILTARCALTRWRDNYDHNAWSGTRKGPRGWSLTEEEIERGEQKLQGEHLVSELIKGTANDDLVPLDAVGGTILYIRASLVWSGLNFPYQYVVGTRWGKDGWDGLESEGVCYMARSLNSGRCMLLGGDWHVLHTSD